MQKEAHEIDDLVDEIEVVVQEKDHDLDSPVEIDNHYFK